MGFNVSTSMGFENKDFLRNAAKNILNNAGVSSETASKITESAIFADRSNSDMYTNASLSVLKASTQISVNNSLKETLKYLRAHANKKDTKKHVFGELWNILETTNQISDENQGKSEIYEFHIDLNEKNIFAA